MLVPMFIVQKATRERTVCRS